jgi:hypothetical protein
MFRYTIEFDPRIHSQDHERRLCETLRLLYGNGVRLTREADAPEAKNPVTVEGKAQAAFS